VGDAGNVPGTRAVQFGAWGAGRLQLVELGRLVGDMDYAVVSKTIARFEQRLRTDPQLRDQPNDK
jgi:hypothetical protein